MGKRLQRTQALLALVLLYQLSQPSYAAAGFFDWLASKDVATVVVQPLNENRVSYSSNIWNTVSTNTEKKELEEVVKEEYTVLSTHKVGASGYSSTPDQTDDTPFITASGKYVRDGIIAANVYLNGKRVPFGTMIRIPDIFGDKIFVVEDRMNARYTNNIDIWFPERHQALTFGRKTVTIEIIEHDNI